MCSKLYLVKTDLASAAWNYHWKGPYITALGWDVSIPCKRGNINLDFRKSLLKYPRNKRKHKFVIIRITVD